MPELNTMKSTPKTLKKPYFAMCIAIFLISFTTTHAQEVTPQAQPGVVSHFFGNFSLKNFFIRSVEQKKEYLEKNRDIRNKIIEEQSSKPEKLNIKFYIQPDTSVDPETAKLVAEFSDNINQLEDIKERISTRIDKLSTTVDTTSALDYVATSTVKLSSARLTVQLLASTTATTTPKEELALHIISDTKAARDALIRATVSLAEKIVPFEGEEADLTATSTYFLETYEEPAIR